MKLHTTDILLYVIFSSKTPLMNDITKSLVKKLFENFSGEGSYLGQVMNISSNKHFNRQLRFMWLFEKGGTTSDVGRET